MRIIAISVLAFALVAFAPVPTPIFVPALAQSQIPDWMRKAVNEYRPKLGQLKKGDADALYELGAWVRKAGLDGSGQRLFREAIKAKPDHEAARKALGYVKKGSKWERDYLSTAKKITSTFDQSLTGSGGYAAAKQFLDDPKNLAAILKDIDDRSGLYRPADDIQIAIQFKGSASGVGVTWPVSAMGNDRVPPPFVSSVELDGSVILGKDVGFLRKVLTHELTHAMMGAVQIFMTPYQAEGYASYVADDDVGAYRQYKSFWTNLRSQYGAEKVKEWGRMITDEYAELWIEGASSVADAAFKKIFGKTGAELGGR